MSKKTCEKAQSDFQEQALTLLANQGVEPTIRDSAWSFIINVSAFGSLTTLLQSSQINVASFLIAQAADAESLW